MVAASITYGCSLYYTWLQVGIPTIAVMENMCGLSLPWAAPVADFAARHALPAAATEELEALFTASQAESV